MFALKLLILTLWLLNFVGNIVSPGCPNCEAPWGPYCCKTAHRGTCCEYPIGTEDEDFANTPLARNTWVDNGSPGVTLRPGRMAGKANDLKKGK